MYEQVFADRGYDVMREYSKSIYIFFGSILSGFLVDAFDRKKAVSIVKNQPVIVVGVKWTDPAPARPQWELLCLSPAGFGCILEGLARSA